MLLKVTWTEAWLCLCVCVCVRARARAGGWAYVCVLGPGAFEGWKCLEIPRTNGRTSNLEWAMQDLRLRCALRGLIFATPVSDFFFDQMRSRRHVLASAARYTTTHVCCADLTVLCLESEQVKMVKDNHPYEYKGSKNKQNGHCFLERPEDGRVMDINGFQYKAGVGQPDILGHFAQRRFYCFFPHGSTRKLTPFCRFICCL